VRAVRSFTGVPSSIPKPCIAGFEAGGTTLAGGWFVAVVGGAAFCASMTVAVRDTTSQHESNFFNMMSSFWAGLSGDRKAGGGRSPDKP